MSKIRRHEVKGRISELSVSYLCFSLSYSHFSMSASRYGMSPRTLQRVSLDSSSSFSFSPRLNADFPCYNVDVGAHVLLKPISSPLLVLAYKRMIRAF